MIGDALFGLLVVGLVVSLWVARRLRATYDVWDEPGWVRVGTVHRDGYWWGGVCDGADRVLVAPVGMRWWLMARLARRHRPSLCRLVSDDCQPHCYHFEAWTQYDMRESS